MSEGQRKLEELNPGVDRFKVSRPVYYEEQGNEVLTALRAYAHDIPIVFRGPTGCGKSTLAEYICYLLGAGFKDLRKKYGPELRKAGRGDETALSRLEKKTEMFRNDEGFPLVTIGGHEDLDADTLKGRPYIVEDKAFWLNGNAKLAAQYGGIFYFDEPAEARPDALVVIHSLTDHRRSLPVEGLGEVIRAHESFGFIMTYNDKYQDPRKRFKPSTSQRFIHVPLSYPQDPAFEIKIAQEITGIDPAIARGFVKIAHETRNLAKQRKIREGASPREVIMASELVISGESPFRAAAYCLAYPLTDDADVQESIFEIIKNQFRE
ncbi:CbbQ/NirQ/NorQ C-terminal domain-containing protein [Candidatus Woesearchaeota archaeon]|nr:CbbQ/NirQ/NorQ C-terminal domain-containing protein [Candidatus Woesearchaeota archaeon]